MDVEATYALMIAEDSDMDERAVASVDLLFWLADGRGTPWTPMQIHNRAELAKSLIFAALDRLAELEETCAKPT